MIEPIRKDEELLQDIAEWGEQDSALHVWWLGQSGFLLKQGGSCFLFDPYLSDSLTTKYAATDKPHVRMTARCIDPGKLVGVREVTASHVHTDHLDGETLGPLAHANGGLRLYLPFPVRDVAKERLGDARAALVGVTDDGHWHGDEWKVRGIAAKHNELRRDDYGRCHFLGFVVKRGPFTVFHSGDTLWHEGLVPELLREKCDLMLLPINGNKPERRVAGNLNGTEAAALAKACGARMVVPCHYEMFGFNTETPEEFETACERLDQPCMVMQCGGHLTMDARS